ncbi:sugar ABC transporter ATP-binding protein [Sorangium sp. So ce542]|uniref:sugar ABC transporter ATP-binding protein n=1 Tax=Sorangium sp. So ce542 TaxID=3133316 RepID=UPI003F602903
MTLAPAPLPLPDPPPLLAMRGIVKRFPGVTALAGVSLTLRAGEVLAVVGENGAGKSTLMKILGGAFAPDEGQIAIDGAPVALRGVRDGRRLGVALIHQELMLAPNLDIAANIFLGNEGSRGLLAPLRREALCAGAAALMRRVGLSLPPTTPVSALSAGQMQMVEIAKALSVDARIILMDEPTSSLTAAESRELFAIVERLRAEGIGILYISHRMDDVLRLADRIAVLRDGRHVGDVPRAEATHDRIVAMMVGRELSGRYFPEKRERPPREPALEVRDLLVPGAPAGVSFTALRGEILGFAGLVGSGRTELMQTIFGATRALGGAMTLAGAPYLPRSTRDAIDRGVCLAPEDRKRRGLVLPMTLVENTSLPSLARFSRSGWLRRDAERRAARDEVDRLRIKAKGLDQRAVNLSGGNQQKVVLGKWLSMRPRVLILDEPTRGIDVGTKAEIYRHMAAMVDEGMTLLMVSSDMEEILGMSDRVVVMHERRITGVLPREGLTQERIAALMTGSAGAAGGEETV